MEIAEYAVLQAGKAIMEVYQSGDYRTEIKQNESPLTTADKKSHEIITRHLRKTNLPVLSEEGINIDFGERKRWELFWMIDPWMEQKNLLIK